MKYPSQRKTLATRSGSWKDEQVACSNVTRKNGNQQATKAPVMIANVFAAFLSRFASIVSRVFLVEDVIDVCWEGTGVTDDTPVADVVVVKVVIVVVFVVVISTVVDDCAKFAPLYDDFSGETDE